MISEANRVTLERNLHSIEERLLRASERANRRRDEVTLIAVTKTVSVDVASALVEMGQTHLGESRPQELWKKAEALPEVEWHLIGHLQTNKLARTIPLVKLTHSVDREKLLFALENEGAKQEQTWSVLLEVNASREESKTGFVPEAMTALIPRLNELKHVRIHGLMTMAAWEENPEECRSTFVLLRELRDDLKNRIDDRHPMNELSMGMSNDFEVAVEEGATFVRVGTSLFEGIS